ncbi:asparaginase [Solwaraspora sp. WMMD1047]|uniref:asparaginase n=1 Tax=Solwaraspora sp. WMMD1047 TaxID=3016102 RepID=UPI0024172B07|nr:asparaginase [Solwaraspora sp. WMMD1047]MDG4833647.1 asparaginase [Solwaraspora sp. WMMD1047]
MTKTYQGGVPLAEVVRSGFAESAHRGSIAVLTATGSMLVSAGDIESPIFPRSASKPLQAVGMLRSGLRLADPADLALVCASHHGEQRHVARVAALLAGAGLSPAALRCPPDLPVSEDARTTVLRAGGGRSRLQMNCSGKHTGMLLTCLAAGWPTDGYWRPEHPLQERISAAIEEFTGEPAVAVGVDGCGAPVLSASLTGLATAYLRLVSAEPGSVPRTVADAMRAHPTLVAGTGPTAYDSQFLAAVPGLLVKGGAEGVIAAALLGVGAVAVKVDDGAGRACLPALTAGLRRLGVTASIPPELAEPVVYGGGEPVGAVRALW